MNWPDDFINKIICGDCLEVMKELPRNSIDAIVTDPPYGLEFMGKEWDKLESKRSRYKGKERSFFGDFVEKNMHNLPQLHQSRNFKCKICGKYKWDYPKRKCQCESPHWDTRHYGNEQQAFHQEWLTEAYRVLKPGGSMLVMGGTRTSHRLACAIEDTGFIIKDTLMWIYGSGFPKAQDLGKMIDKRNGKLKTQSRGFNTAGGKENYEKQDKSFRSDYGYQYNPSTDLAKHWDGFKVGGIKPAYEPIIWAVKPPEGSYVDNVLKWGVGAVNVNECRVVTTQFEQEEMRKMSKGFVGKKMGRPELMNYGYESSMPIKTLSEPHAKGRFPANVILSHHPECVQVGMKRVRSGTHGKAQGGFNPTGKTIYGKGNPRADVSGGYNNEQVESWDCHPDCAVRLLDEQSGNLSSGKPAGIKAGGKLNCYGVFAGGIPVTGIGDSGGASRFFYCAKASKSERGQDNKHPTVKPIALFMWLIQLVTREGQLIFDPFIGSGTTMLASQGCNRKCVGIEKDRAYCKIAEERLAQGVL